MIFPLAPLRAAGRAVQHAWNLPEKWALAARGPRAGLTLPQFLGIGTQKAGTTWLHRMLRGHPELYLPARKELHYFDLRFHRSLRYYASWFAPGAGRRCGEITPAYAVLPEARLRFVRRLLPDVRLVLLLRNPVDRAWSGALMTLVTRPGRPFESVSEREFLAHFRSVGSLARGRYTEVLDRWLRYFSAEQLLIGSLEEVRDRPEVLLGRVLQHLGCTPDVDWSALPLREPVSAGPPHPLPDRFRRCLYELYQGEIEGLAARYPEVAGSWLATGGPGSAPQPIPVGSGAVPRPSSPRRSASPAGG